MICAEQIPYPLLKNDYGSIESAVGESVIEYGKACQCDRQGARRATPEKPIRLNLSFNDGYFLLLYVLLDMICSEETLELSTVHYPK